MSDVIPDNPTQDVFERVLARPVAAPDLQHGRLVQVQWRAPQQGDRLVQVYANRRRVATTASASEREAWLVLDAKVHHEIELLAVPARCAATDFAPWLQGLSPRTQPAIDLAVMRDVLQPVGSELSVDVDGLGQPTCVPLFAQDVPRSGFGAVFGEGGFGYDASTGPGLGRGALGYGPLGVGGCALRWRDESLAVGAHSIDVALSSAGQTQSQNTLDCSVDRLPKPPTHLELNEELLLTWN